MADSRLHFHPAARAEVLAAYDWYAERNNVAADSFQTELENAGRIIEREPEVFSQYLHGTRRFLLKHFPFSIIYRVQSDQIEIIAVAHQRRRPGYWMDRTRNSD